MENIKGNLIKTQMIKTQLSLTVYSSNRKKENINKQVETDKIIIHQNSPGFKYINT